MNFAALDTLQEYVESATLLLDFSRMELDTRKRLAKVVETGLFTASNSLHRGLAKAIGGPSFQIRRGRWASLWFENIQPGSVEADMITAAKVAFTISGKSDKWYQKYNEGVSGPHGHIYVYDTPVLRKSLDRSKHEPWRAKVEPWIVALMTGARAEVVDKDRGGNQNENGNT